MTADFAPRSVTLAFRIGARTIAAASRRLVRVAWSLERALAGERAVLPPLADAEGYLLTSMPETLPPDAGRGLLRVVRQRYRRHFIDLTIGRDPWLAGLSPTTRSGIRRKAKRLAAHAEGEVSITSYRTPNDMAAFHGPARAVSSITYQERLLGAGLPTDFAGLAAKAAADEVRAWLLRIGERPVAYLCCTADGATLRYDHVGHDPAFSALSPGAVLQAAAVETLFADRFAWFDFTEGEGQHKRSFATGSIDCVDLLLLRPSVSNRLLASALRGFDRGLALARIVADRPALARAKRWVRRAG